MNSSTLTPACGLVAGDYIDVGNILFKVLRVVNKPGKLCPREDQIELLLRRLGSGNALGMAQMLTVQSDEAFHVWKPTQS